MNVYVYIVFHVFEDGSREVCGIFAKPGEAKKHCDNHPTMPGVEYFAVTQAPIWGFPWFGILALIVLVGVLGHIL